MKQEVLDILFETFYTNKASIGVVKQDDKKIKRFQLLLEYSYFLCEKHGKIYLSEEKNSCALLLDSSIKQYSFKKIYWQFILAFKVIGVFRAKKILKRLSVLKKSRPRESHIYLWYLGVKKNHQGKGLGSELMDQIKVDFADRIICLETTREENIPFYLKAGFKNRGKINGLEYPFVLFEKKPS